MAENVSTDLSRLVEEIQNGRAESEAALYERFAERVFYVALRGTKSTQDADDVRAETFLRVLQAIRARQLRSAASLPSFILGVTRNVLNELYARRRHGQDVSPDDANLSAPSHERFFLDREVQRSVQETLETLKPRDRAVLRMCFYDELPTDEIARRAGIPPERVRLVKSRALKRFRENHHRLRLAARRNS